MPLARFKENEVATAVEGIWRTCHGFNREAQAVWVRRLLVRGVDLEPRAGPVPGHSHAGADRVPEQHPSLAPTVEGYVREGVVYLGGADGPWYAEVELMPCHGAYLFWQQAVRSDLQEAARGNLKGPIAQR